MSPRARLYDAGLTVRALAQRAGLSAGGVSNTLTGRRRNPLTQRRVLQAYRDLTRHRITSEQFWGALLSRPSGRGRRRR